MREHWNKARTVCGRATCESHYQTKRDTKRNTYILWTNKARFGQHQWREYQNKAHTSCRWEICKTRSVPNQERYEANQLPPVNEQSIRLGEHEMKDYETMHVQPVNKRAKHPTWSASDEMSLELKYVQPVRKQSVRPSQHPMEEELEQKALTTCGRVTRDMVSIKRRKIWNKAHTSCERATFPTQSVQMTWGLKQNTYLLWMGKVSKSFSIR